jgi:hypothetical protein
MTDEEYQEFLDFLFERYARPRITQVRRRFLHHRQDEFSYYLDQAIDASHVLRYIESYCDRNEDIYETFTLERITRAVSEIRYSLDFSRRLAEESGFMDAYEEYEREILAGLQPHHLPEADKEVMREMGSPNPEVELRILVYSAKERRGKTERNSKEMPTRKRIEYAEKELKKAEKQFEEAESQNKEESIDLQPKKSRRWFKGIGRIGQGAALSIANIGLAVGAIKFPVSPETQTWGAVASVATGIGTILDGIGDLRSE